MNFGENILICQMIHVLPTPSTVLVADEIVGIAAVL